MRDDTLIRKMVMFRCGRLPEGSVDRVQMLMPCTEDVPNSIPITRTNEWQSWAVSVLADMSRNGFEKM